MVTITLYCPHWETRCSGLQWPYPQRQTAVSLPCVRTAKPREPDSPRLPRSSPRGDFACLSRTQQFARPDSHVWRLSHHRVQVDQKKVAQLPPFSTTLVAPDPEDAASTTLELDELWSFVLNKVNQVWVWIALCRKTRQVVASALGDRSLPDVSTVVGGHSIRLPPRALLHRLLGSISGGHP